MSITLTYSAHNTKIFVALFLWHNGARSFFNYKRYIINVSMIPMPDDQLVYRHDERDGVVSLALKVVDCCCECDAMFCAMFLESSTAPEWTRMYLTFL